MYKIAIVWKDDTCLQIENVKSVNIDNQSIVISCSNNEDYIINLLSVKYVRKYHVNNAFDATLGYTS